MIEIIYLLLKIALISTSMAIACLIIAGIGIGIINIIIAIPILIIDGIKCLKYKVFVNNKN